MGEQAIRRLKAVTLLFKGTSGDLLFWALIDTLFLTQVKGFTVTEVSLSITVSFWVAFLFKKFGYAGIKKMGIGKSLIFSAILFLASAFLITLAPNLPLVIVGQCLYTIAPDFYGVSDILLKKLCAIDKGGKDYVESRSLSSTLYSTITLIAALLVNPLMDIHPYLPMFICIATRLLSLALAIFIYARAGSLEEQEPSYTPVSKTRRFVRSTVDYLFMAAFFGALSSLSITYLKLKLQDNLAAVYNETTVVTVFTYCIVAARVFKILGNTLTKRAKRRGVEYASLSVTLSFVGVFAAIFGLAGVILTGRPAIVAAAVGLFGIYFVYDTMFVVQSYLIIENLNQDQAVTALYRRGLLDTLIGSVASSIATAALAANSYLGVMFLLLVNAFAVLIFAVLGMQHRHNLSAIDYYNVWPADSIEKTDSLLVSAAMLMVRYGVVQPSNFNPSVLKAHARSVEHIQDHYRHFGLCALSPTTTVRASSSMWRMTAWDSTLR